MSTTRKKKSEAARDRGVSGFFHGSWMSFNSSLTSALRRVPLSQTARVYSGVEDTYSTEPYIISKALFSTTKEKKDKKPSRRGHSSSKQTPDLSDKARRTILPPPVVTAPPLYPVEDTATENVTTTDTTTDTYIYSSSPFGDLDFSHIDDEYGDPSAVVDPFAVIAKDAHIPTNIQWVNVAAAAKGDVVVNAGVHVAVAAAASVLGEDEDFNPFGQNVVEAIPDSYTSHPAQNTVEASAVCQGAIEKDPTAVSAESKAPQYDTSLFDVSLINSTEEYELKEPVRYDTNSVINPLTSILKTAASFFYLRVATDVRNEIVIVATKLDYFTRIGQYLYRTEDGQWKRKDVPEDRSRILSGEELARLLEAMGEGAELAMGAEHQYYIRPSREELKIGRWSQLELGDAGPAKPHVDAVISDILKANAESNAQRLESLERQQLTRDAAAEVATEDGTVDVDRLMSSWRAEKQRKGESTDVLGLGSITPKPDGADSAPESVLKTTVSASSRSEADLLIRDMPVATSSRMQFRNMPTIRTSQHTAQAPARDDVDDLLDNKPKAEYVDFGASEEAPATRYEDELVRASTTRLELPTSRDVDTIRAELNMTLRPSQFKEVPRRPVVATKVLEKGAESVAAGTEGGLLEVAVDDILRELHARKGGKVTSKGTSSSSTVLDADVPVAPLSSDPAVLEATRAIIRDTAAADSAKALFRQAGKPGAAAMTPIELDVPVNESMPSRVPTTRFVPAQPQFEPFTGTRSARDTLPSRPRPADTTEQVLPHDQADRSEADSRVAALLARHASRPTRSDPVAERKSSPYHAPLSSKSPSVPDTKIVDSARFRSKRLATAVRVTQSPPLLRPPAPDWLASVALSEEERAARYPSIPLISEPDSGLLRLDDNAGRDEIVESRRPDRRVVSQVRFMQSRQMLNVALSKASETRVDVIQGKRVLTDGKVALELDSLPSHYQDYLKQQVGSEGYLAKVGVLEMGEMLSTAIKEEREQVVSEHEKQPQLVRDAELDLPAMGDYSAATAIPSSAPSYQQLHMGFLQRFAELRTDGLLCYREVHNIVTAEGYVYVACDTNAPVMHSLTRMYATQDFAGIITAFQEAYLPLLRATAAYALVHAHPAMASVNLDDPIATAVKALPASAPVRNIHPAFVTAPSEMVFGNYVTMPLTLREELASIQDVLDVSSITPTEDSRDVSSSLDQFPFLIAHPTMARILASAFAGVRRPDIAADIIQQHLAHAYACDISSTAVNATEVLREVAALNRDAKKEPRAVDASSVQMRWQADMVFVDGDLTVNLHNTDVRATYLPPAVAEHHHLTARRIWELTRDALSSKNTNSDTRAWARGVIKRSVLDGIVKQVSDATAYLNHHACTMRDIAREYELAHGVVATILCMAHNDLSLEDAVELARDGEIDISLDSLAARQLRAVTTQQLEGLLSRKEELTLSTIDALDLSAVQSVGTIPAEIVANYIRASLRAMCLEMNFSQWANKASGVVSHAKVLVACAREYMPLLERYVLGCARVGDIARVREVFTALDHANIVDPDVISTRVPRMWQAHQYVDATGENVRAFLQQRMVPKSIQALLDMPYHDLHALPSGPAAVAQLDEYNRLHNKLVQDLQATNAGTMYQSLLCSPDLAHNSPNTDPVTLFSAAQFTSLLDQARAQDMSLSMHLCVYTALLSYSFGLDKARARKDVTKRREAMTFGEVEPSDSPDVNILNPDDSLSYAIVVSALRARVPLALSSIDAPELETPESVFDKHPVDKDRALHAPTPCTFSAHPAAVMPADLQPTAWDVRVPASPAVAAQLKNNTSASALVLVGASEGAVYDNYYYYSSEYMRTAVTGSRGVLLHPRYYNRPAYKQLTSRFLNIALAVAVRTQSPQLARALLGFAPGIEAALLSHALKHSQRGSTHFVVDQDDALLSRALLIASDAEKMDLSQIAPLSQSSRGTIPPITTTHALNVLHDTLDDGILRSGNSRSSLFRAGNSEFDSSVCQRGTYMFDSNVLMTALLRPFFAAPQMHSLHATLWPALLSLLTSVPSTSTLGAPLLFGVGDVLTRPPLLPEHVTGEPLPEMALQDRTALRDVAVSSLLQGHLHRAQGLPWFTFANPTNAYNASASYSRFIRTQSAAAVAAAAAAEANAASKVLSKKTRSSFRRDEDDSESQPLVSVPMPPTSARIYPTQVLRALTLVAGPDVPIRASSVPGHTLRAVNVEHRLVHNDALVHYLISSAGVSSLFRDFVHLPDQVQADFTATGALPKCVRLNTQVRHGPTHGLDLAPVLAVYNRFGAKHKAIAMIQLFSQLRAEAMHVLLAYTHTPQQFSHFFALSDHMQKVRLLSTLPRDTAPVETRIWPSTVRTASTMSPNVHFDDEAFSAFARSFVNHLDRSGNADYSTASTSDPAPEGVPADQDLNLGQQQENPIAPLHRDQWLKLVQNTAGSPHSFLQVLLAAAHPAGALNKAHVDADRGRVRDARVLFDSSLLGDINRSHGGPWSPYMMSWLISNLLAFIPTKQGLSEIMRTYASDGFAPIVEPISSGLVPRAEAITNRRENSLTAPPVADVMFNFDINEARQRHILTSAADGLYCVDLAYRQMVPSLTTYYGLRRSTEVLTPRVDIDVLSLRPTRFVGLPPQPVVQQQLHTVHAGRIAVMMLSIGEAPPAYLMDKVLHRLARLPNNQHTPYPVLLRVANEYNKLKRTAVVNMLIAERSRLGSAEYLERYGIRCKSLDDAQYLRRVGRGFVDVSKWERASTTERAVVDSVYVEGRIDASRISEDVGRARDRAAGVAPEKIHPPEKKDHDFADVVLDKVLEHMDTNAAGSTELLNSFLVDPLDVHDEIASLDPTVFFRYFNSAQFPKFVLPLLREVFIPIYYAPASLLADETPLLLMYAVHRALNTQRIPLDSPAPPATRPPHQSSYSADGVLRQWRPRDWSLSVRAPVDSIFGLPYVKGRMGLDSHADGVLNTYFSAIHKHTRSYVHEHTPSPTDPAVMLSVSPVAVHESLARASADPGVYNEIDPAAHLNTVVTLKKPGMERVSLNDHLPRVLVPHNASTPIAAMAHTFSFLNALSFSCVGVNCPFSPMSHYTRVDLVTQLSFHTTRINAFLSSRLSSTAVSRIGTFLKSKADREVFGEVAYRANNYLSLAWFMDMARVAEDHLWKHGQLDKNFYRRYLQSHGEYRDISDEDITIILDMCRSIICASSVTFRDLSVPRPVFNDVNYDDLVYFANVQPLNPTVLDAEQSASCVSALVPVIDSWDPVAALTEVSPVAVPVGVSDDVQITFTTDAANATKAANAVSAVDTILPISSSTDAPVQGDVDVHRANALVAGCYARVGEQYATPAARVQALQEQMKASAGNNHTYVANMLAMERVLTDVLRSADPSAGSSALYQHGLYETWTESMSIALRTVRKTFHAQGGPCRILLTHLSASTVRAASRWALPLPRVLAMEVYRTATTTGDFAALFALVENALPVTSEAKPDSPATSHHTPSAQVVVNHIASTIRTLQNNSSSNESLPRVLPLLLAFAHKLRLPLTEQTWSAAMALLQHIGPAYFSHVPADMVHLFFPLLAFLPASMVKLPASTVQDALALCSTSTLPSAAAVRYHTNGMLVVDTSLTSLAQMEPDPELYRTRAQEFLAAGHIGPALNASLLHSIAQHALGTTAVTGNLSACRETFLSLLQHLRKSLRTAPTSVVLHAVDQWAHTYLSSLHVLARGTLRVRPEDISSLLATPNEAIETVPFALVPLFTPALWRELLDILAEHSAPTALVVQQAALCAASSHFSTTALYATLRTQPLRQDNSLPMDTLWAHVQAHVATTTAQGDGNVLDYYRMWFTSLRDEPVSPALSQLLFGQALFEGRFQLQRFTPTLRPVGEAAVAAQRAMLVYADNEQTVPLARVARDLCMDTFAHMPFLLNATETTDPTLYQSSLLLKLRPYDSLHTSAATTLASLAHGANEALPVEPWCSNVHVAHPIWVDNDVPRTGSAATLAKASVALRYASFLRDMLYAQSITQMLSVFAADGQSVPLGVYEYFESNIAPLVQATYAWTPVTREEFASNTLLHSLTHTGMAADMSAKLLVRAAALEHLPALSHVRLMSALHAHVLTFSEHIASTLATLTELARDEESFPALNMSLRVDAVFNLLNPGVNMLNENDLTAVDVDSDAKVWGVLLPMRPELAPVHVSALRTLKVSATPLSALLEASLGNMHRALAMYSPWMLAESAAATPTPRSVLADVVTVKRARALSLFSALTYVQAVAALLPPASAAHVSADVLLSLSRTCSVNTTPYEDNMHVDSTAEQVQQVFDYITFGPRRKHQRDQQSESYTQLTSGAVDTLPLSVFADSHSLTSLVRHVDPVDMLLALDNDAFYVNGVSDAAALLPSAVTTIIDALRTHLQGELSPSVRNTLVQTYASAAAAMLHYSKRDVAAEMLRVAASHVEQLGEANVVCPQSQHQPTPVAAAVNGSVNLPSVLDTLTTYYPLTATPAPIAPPLVPVPRIEQAVQDIMFEAGPISALAHQGIFLPTGAPTQPYPFRDPRCSNLHFLFTNADGLAQAMVGVCFNSPQGPMAVHTTHISADYGRGVPYQHFYMYVGKEEDQEKRIWRHPYLTHSSSVETLRKWGKCVAVPVLPAVHSLVPVAAAHSGVGLSAMEIDLWHVARNLAIDQDSPLDMPPLESIPAPVIPPLPADVIEAESSATEVPIAETEPKDTAFPVSRRFSAWDDAANEIKLDDLVTL